MSKRSKSLESLTALGLRPARAQPRPDAPDFPFGLGQSGVHELVETGYGDFPSAAGFALSALGAGKPPGTLLWVSQWSLGRAHGRLYHHGLPALMQSPPRLLHVETRKAQAALWAIEEAITSKAVSLVIGEVEDLDFTASRRLTLATQRCGVPLVLLMPYTREGATAAQARWRLAPCASAPNPYDPAAPGNPRWQARLERSRLAPHRAGEIFNLELDHETLSLTLASGLASDASAPGTQGRTDRFTAPRLRQAS